MNQPTPEDKAKALAILPAMWEVNANYDTANQCRAEIAQALADARGEDTKLLDFLLENPSCIPSGTHNDQWIVQKYIGRTIGRGKTKRDALRAALEEHK